MIQIDDNYGAYDLDTDEIIYVSWHENNVGIRAGSRLWKLVFEETEEARRVVTSVIECLDYNPLVIKASMWTHYIDLDEITAIGPVLPCPKKGSLYHLVLDTGLGDITIKDTQAKLLEHRSMILDALKGS